MYRTFIYIVLNMISKLENAFELKTRRGSYTTASYYLGKEVYNYICIKFWRMKLIQKHF